MSSLDNLAVQAMRGGHFGLEWEDVTASRTGGVVYTNITSKTMQGCITFDNRANLNYDGTVSVNGVIVGRYSSDGGAAAFVAQSITFDVPPGGEYIVNANVGFIYILHWAELK